MHPSEPEVLLANAGWVRALARELAGSRGADDLVQETWLVALRRRGNERKLSAWLAGVVRHLARRARRGEENRTSREGARPPGIEAPPTDELVATAEIHGRLVAAVLGLEEPYRSTVLLRYFRGLSLEETARAGGVPVATARTRLARALARLRATLDRTCGKEVWGRALLLLGSAPPAAGGLGELGRSAWPSTKTKLGLAAALACALTSTIVWQGLTRQGESSRVHSPSRREGAVLASTASPTLAEQEASAVGITVARSAREAMRTEAPETTAGTLAGALAYGSLTDEHGELVEEGWVTLDDDRGNRRGGPLSEPWSWSIDGLEAGRWRLRAGGRDRTTIEEELVVPPGRLVLQRDLVLESGLAIRIRVVDERGEPLDPREAGIRFVASLEPLPEDVAGSSSVMDPYEAGRFVHRGAGERIPEGCHALFRCSAPLPVLVTALLGSAILETKPVTRPVAELVFRFHRGDIEARLGGLRARFVDARSRRPVPRGTAHVLQAMGSFGASPVDELGGVLFERQQPGAYRLSFRHDDYIRAPLGVTVPEGRLADLGDVPVWPKARLRGEVIDEQGKHVGMLCAWSVLSELEGPPDLQLGSWLHVPGTFEIEVARAPLLLVFRASDGTRYGLRIDASSGEVDGIVVQLRNGVPETFRHGSESGRLSTMDGESSSSIVTSLLDARDLGLALERYQLWIGAD